MPSPTTVRRLADSCLVVTTDDLGTTLFDPGFFTFDEQPVDLDGIGDVQRVCITHEHADHVKPEFVAWLLDRGTDVTVHGNQAVVDLLARHDVPATTDVPDGTTVQDVDHEVLPTGATVPNRSWTLGEAFTHPGDSYAPTRAGRVLALPLLAPWGSATAAVRFAARLGVEQVVPIHDFYLSASGRQRINQIVGGAFAAEGIELVGLDWGEGFTA